MEQKDFVLLEFVFNGHNKKYLVQKNSKNSIGYEIGKFICYIDDYNLCDYIKNELKNNNLTFNEFFCVTNISRDNYIKEIVSEDFLFDIIYTIDFDHNIINYNDIRKDKQFSCCLPFEIVSKFPLQTEVWY